MSFNLRHVFPVLGILTGMGSSFSVVNDTEERIWVSHGACRAGIRKPVGNACRAIAAKFKASKASTAAAAVEDGAAAGTAGDTAAGVEGGVAARVVGAKAAAGTVLGLSSTTWALFRSVSGLLTFTPGAINGLSTDEERKVLSIKKHIEETYAHIEPKGKHTVKGTLSLVLRACVIYNDGRKVQRNCWTGAKPGSEKEYPVSQNF